MRRIVMLSSLVLLLGATGWAAMRLTGMCGTSGGTLAAAKHGTALGQFDPVMSGVCRFSCATQEAVDEVSLVAQPGARAGDLTRCPVSGVVFAVDQDRPAVHVAAADYVVCCAECAGKLAKEPGNFLKL